MTYALAMLLGAAAVWLALRLMHTKDGRKGVLVINTKGLPDGYVLPSASLSRRGQYTINNEQATPDTTRGPIVIKDIND